MSTTTSSTRSWSTRSPAAQGQEIAEEKLPAVAAAAAHPVVEHEKHKVPQPVTVSNKATFLGYYSSSTQNSSLGN